MWEGQVQVPIVQNKSTYQVFNQLLERVNKQELSSQLALHEPNLILETQNKKVFRKTVKKRLSRGGSISKADPNRKLLPMLKN